MEPYNADRDENVIPDSAGIDRSLGYLAVGLLVASFFLLTLFGMSRFERITKATTLADPEPRPAAPAEIGGIGQ